MGVTMKTLMAILIFMTLLLHRTIGEDHYLIKTPDDKDFLLETENKDGYSEDYGIENGEIGDEIEEIKEEGTEYHDDTSLTGAVSNKQAPVGHIPLDPAPEFKHIPVPSAKPAKKKNTKTH